MNSLRGALWLGLWKKNQLPLMALGALILCLTLFNRVCYPNGWIPVSQRPMASGQLDSSCPPSRWTMRDIMPRVEPGASVSNTWSPPSGLFYIAVAMAAGDIIAGR
jgi:hypothetical protein